MLNLNKIFNFYYGWWKNIDKFILFLILFLFLLGLFFSLVSTSIIASDKLNTNTYYFFIKHLFFIYSSLGINITKYIKIEKLITKNRKKNNKLTPETNINENQVSTINIVCPISG